MPRHTEPSWQIEEWPPADQRAWSIALEAGDTLAPGGSASHWRPSTAQTVARSYGHFVKWLDAIERLDVGAEAASQITEENIAEFIAVIRTPLSGHTVASRISQIYMAAKAMSPDADWSWLSKIWKRLEREARPLRDKNCRLVEAADLRACGIEAMEDAAKGEYPRLCEAATLYRDGMLAALLAARPLRLANLTQIEIGRHLQVRGDGYWLSFEPHETKNHQRLEAPFPDDLAPYLEEYVSLYRTLLLRNAKRKPEDANRLWLSTWGKGLCENMVYRRIMKLTEERLGRAINPHAFRHAAATSIAFSDPEHVSITKSILGHTTLASSEQYYNLAQEAEATRRYHEHLASLRMQQP